MAAQHKESLKLFTSPLHNRASSGNATTASRSRSRLRGKRGSWASRYGVGVVWLSGKRYSVTARPSGSESRVAPPAIVWIGATLPLAVAAKPRIAFEPGLETNTSPLTLLTASPKLKPFPPLSPVFEPEMVRTGATFPCAPAANSLIVAVLVSKT